MQEKNKKLKEASAELKYEKDYLESDIEEKQDSIIDLKVLNVKVTKDHVELLKQYEELQGRFDNQEEENDRLKQELESSKALFYQKMMAFYEKEEEMLGQEGLTIEEWQEEVREKLEALKEEMGLYSE